MMTCGSTAETNAHRPRRRGVVLVVVLVTISISLTLFGLWARTIVQEHRRQANQQFRLQAARLAEAGVRRAMQRRAADPQFEEDTWMAPAEHLGGTHAAKVRIRATPNDDTTALRYEATAEFPTGAVRRAQITKRIEIATPLSGNES